MLLTRNKGLGHDQTETAMGKFTTARLKHAECNGKAGRNFWPLCKRGGCVAAPGEPAQHSTVLCCSSRKPHRQAVQMKAGLVGGCRRTVQVLSAQPPLSHSGSLCRTAAWQLPGQRATSSSQEPTRGHRATALQLNSLFRLKTTPSTFTGGEKIPIPAVSVASINECFCFHLLEK